MDAAPTAPPAGSSTTPPERFLSVAGGEPFADPGGTCSCVTQFLGLPPGGLPGYDAPNAARYSGPIEPATQAALRTRYRRRNRQLYELIGRDLGWR